MQSEQQEVQEPDQDRLMVRQSRSHIVRTIWHMNSDEILISLPRRLAAKGEYYRVEQQGNHHIKLVRVNGECRKIKIDREPPQSPHHSSTHIRLCRTVFDNGGTLTIRLPRPFVEPRSSFIIVKEAPGTIWLIKAEKLCRFSPKGVPEAILKEILGQ